MESQIKIFREFYEEEIQIFESRIVEKLLPTLKTFCESEPIPVKTE